MRRRVLPFLSILALGLVLSVRADEPAKPQPPAKPAADFAVDQEILSRQFREFEKALLRLAQRLETSTKPEDRETAVKIKKAIQLASDSQVDNKFDNLVKILKSKSLSLQDIREAMNQNKVLGDDIEAIINALRADSRDAELKKERKRLEDLIRKLEDIIRKQKVVRAQTESGKTEKKPLIEAQKKVTKSTADLARDLAKGKDGDQVAKAGDPKKGEGDPKKGEGDPKKGEGDPKKGQGNSQGGNADDTKKGEKKPPMPSADDDKPPMPGYPGRKQVQDANEYQKKAEQDLDKDKREDASNNQSKALKELEEARKKLEEILRQLREEELERLLANLQARCEKMLQMQIEVRDGTVRVFKAIEQNPDKKADRLNEQKSLQLSDREQQIVDEATKAIQLLEAEGSAVAFPEVFLQIREDMRHVTRRLGKADVGSVTQVIEEDIINTLKEMIDALKKKQQQMQANKSNSQSNSKQNQKLLDLLAELKMIRAMQVRVNSRTRVYGEKYPGEQAADTDIQKELTDLAQRQQKIFDVTDNLYRGKNK
jgi:hypothetical protein